MPAGWIRVFLVAFALVAIATSQCLADFSVGGSFAAEGYGARAWGRGGAAIAWGADEGAVYWNPALLALLDQKRLGLSYANLIPGTEARQSYVAYAQTLKAGPVDEPGLEFAEHAAGAIYGNLTLELSDGQTYSENALRLSYAYSPLYFLTFGVSFVGLVTSSDIVNFGANGTALDVSTRMALMKRLTFAAVFRNILSQLEFDDGTNLSLPRSYTLGLAYGPIHNLVVESDIEAQFGDISRFVLGGEYMVYHHILAVRAGVSAETVGENRAVTYLGAGVRVKTFYIDYAVSFDSEEAFENTQRFGLGIGF
jgi:hypothetical protein